MKEEVLPGDTWTTSTSKVVRVQPLVTPIMDNLYLDTYYFFVPNRLVWTHWVNFMGENTASAWIPSVEYTIPKISQPTGGFAVGTIADYLGIPPLNTASGVQAFKYNALPFRAYALICDQWFRDENLMQPLDIPVGDSNTVGVNTGDQVTDIAKGGKPFIVAKYHDYFTSCLPAPQKGPTTTIPINGISDYGLPVYAADRSVFSSSIAESDKYLPYFYDNDGHVVPLNFDYKDSDGYWSDFLGTSSSTYSAISNTGDQYLTGTSAASKVADITPSNLFAYVQDKMSVDVSSMRTAFAIQRYYEKLARSGSRYIESIKAFYGVTSPDARMQRAEYLGGNRVPLNISQVENVTNTSTNIDPIGSVAGLSVTGDTHNDFQFSATEHGYIIGVCCVRYNHTYQQGVERDFLRSTIFDYYNPVFANISEQPITKREIYSVLSGNVTINDLDDVFGYQEAWADYRYKSSRVAGEMRSVYSQSLDVWHLADNYSSVPSLSPEWIREDKSILDRCLAVTSSVSNQLIADFYIQSKVSRPMPMYSVPGLIDHH